MLQWSILMKGAQKVEKPSLFAIFSKEESSSISLYRKVQIPSCNSPYRK